MTELIEYKVRPVIRYMVTRYNETDNSAGSESKGEFDSFRTALEVGTALCSHEHKEKGWPLDDPRIQYPKEQTEEETRQAHDMEKKEAAERWEDFRRTHEQRHALNLS